MKPYYLLIALTVIIFASCTKQKDLNNDNIKPEVGFQSPLNYSKFKANDTVTVVATAYDNSGTISKVLFYVNDQLFCVDSVPPWEQQMVFNKQQQVTLGLKAYNNRNVVSDYQIIVIYIDNALPFIAEIYRDPTSQIYENDSVNFTVVPNVYDRKIVKTSFIFNDELYGVDTSSPYVFHMDSIAAGKYHYYAVLENEIGETTETNVYNFEVEPVLPPEVNLNGPVSGSEYYAGNYVSIDVDVGTNHSPITKTEIFLNDSVIYSGNENFIFQTWIPQKTGEYKIYARAINSDSMVGYSDTATVTVKPSSIIDGVISDLTYSEDDNLVFGINQTTNKLMLINPHTYEIEQITLPYAQPVACDYSLTDKKLYIVYKYTGVVSVWDKSSQLFSSISFSDQDDGRDIEVDETNRRIYLGSNAGLYILNMDNGTVVNKFISSEIKTLVADPVHRWVFVRNSTSPVQLLKYDVSNDNFNLVEVNNEIDWYPQKLAICPDFNFVVLPCRNVNGNGYTLYAYDTHNIHNILGEFNIGNFPAFASFTPDGNFLLGINSLSDEFIYVMQTNNFTLEKKIYFPGSDDNAVLTANYSGDKIVAFSNKDNNSVIYFMDLN